jgi:hypothetical protein
MQQLVGFLVECATKLERAVVWKWMSGRGETSCCLIVVGLCLVVVGVLGVPQLLGSSYCSLLRVEHAVPQSPVVQGHES